MSWIPRLALLLCAQMVCSRPSCSYREYQESRTCCKKCPPGTYALQLCTSKSETICRQCGSNEYQPDWNKEPKCLPQKYCDKERGFDPVRPENRTAPVPCRCQPGRQCFLVNCEYCEKLQVCPPGHGFTRESSGRGSCKPCPSGHFSNISSATEPCKPWTDCKSLGKAVHQLGTEKTDVVCGPHVAGPSTLWVIVVILSFIIVVSLAVLFLFLYRDRWKDLSVNIRTCVQNLKSRTVHQETLPAAYHSGHGLQSCAHEASCLIDHEKNPADSDKTSSGDRWMNGREEPAIHVATEAEPPAARSGDGPPCQGTEGSCICGLSTKEPLEVGENEDCSQAVATCPCNHRGGTAQAPPLLSKGDGADVRGPCNLCSDSCGQEQEGGTGGGEVRGTFRKKEPCDGSMDSTAAPELPSVSDNNLDLPLHGNRDPTLGPELEFPSHGLTSGHVTGNGNTTFISNGQVMNFSGEVLVVYVSQELLGTGTELEGDFSSPVQEELPRSGAALGNTVQQGDH